MAEEMDLFQEYLEDDEKKNFKSILCNGKPVSEDFVLFDSQRFTHFYGCTYSVTASAVNRYLKDFQKVSLIVGIGDIESQGKAQAAIDLLNYLSATNIEKSLSLWKNVNKDIQEKFAEKQFQFYGVNPLFPIHSKFYLLENPETGDKRVIVGSANLTERGLLATTPQYEDIEAWEGHEAWVEALFAEKLRRFKEDLLPKTSPYIDEKLIKTYQEKVNPGKAPIYLKNEVTEIKADRITLINQIIEKNSQEGKIPASQLVELKHAIPVALEKENKIKQEREIHLKILEKTLVKDGKKGLKFAIPKKQQEIIREHLEIKVIKKMHLLERINLERSDSYDSDTLEGNFVMGVGEKGIPFSRKIPTEMRKEKINEILEGMEAFVESYVYYTNLSQASKREQLDYERKVYEAILFAFNAPFLSLIRYQAQEEGYKLTDIPLTLMIAGNGGAGKSEILEVISRLLVGKRYKESVLPFTALGIPQKRSEVATALLQETNVFPLILDEIDLKTFERSSPFGRDNIKANTSYLDGKNPTRYPAMILATNFNGSQSLPFEYARRIYYLEVSETFTKNKESGDKNLKEIYKKITTPLFFQDFLVTYQKYLLQPDFTPYQFESGQIDFLKGTRKIFLDYYQETGRALPEYFPTSRLNEYVENGRNQLALLVKKLDFNADIFKYDPKTDCLYIQSIVLDELLPVKSQYEPNSSETYKQFIRKDLLLENETDRISFAVRATPFFEWLELPNPFKKGPGNLLKKLFKKE